MADVAPNGAWGMGSRRCYKQVAPLEQKREANFNGLTRSGWLGSHCRRRARHSGVGKTELALQLADDWKTDYPDAQLMIDLHGYEQDFVTTERALEMNV